MQVMYTYQNIQVNVFTKTQFEFCYRVIFFFVAYTCSLRNRWILVSFDRNSILTFIFVNVYFLLLLLY